MRGAARRRGWGASQAEGPGWAGHVLQLTLQRGAERVHTLQWRRLVRGRQPTRARAGPRVLPACAVLARCQGSLAASERWVSVTHMQTLQGGAERPHILQRRHLGLGDK